MTGAARRRRIAYVSFSTGAYDSRTERMARSVLDAGHDVVAYARWEPGLPLIEERDGYRLVRVPVDTRLAIPGLAGRARRRLAAEVAASGAAAGSVAGGAAPPAPAPVQSSSRRGEPRAADPRASGPLAAAPPERGITGRVRRAAQGTPLFQPLRRVRDLARLPRRWLLFPASLRAFAIALDQVAEPADLWHGMSIQGLPAVVRRKRRTGGAAVYDSRDIYMHARELARVGGLRRWLFETAERRWAHACDAVLTVNDEYAAILRRQLRVPLPAVVMNCPARWTPPEPRPDRIREALGIAPGTSVVLYQGGLFSERGIEQSMDAILEVPDAVLVLLGYGRLQASLAEIVARDPYRGKVFLLDAVAPAELLTWTASADVMVMAIQPSSLNHRHTTPNKLFEAMAAGVPVVASNLPGMATIVRATGCGVLCDPTSPASIAAAIRALVDAPPEERAALRSGCLAAARDRYNWESQVGTLLALYDRLLGRTRASAMTSPTAAADLAATTRRSVVLVGNPAYPYSRGLRIARVLAGLGDAVEIAAIAGDDAPATETDGAIVTRRYRPSGPWARLGASHAAGAATPASSPTAGARPAGPRGWRIVRVGTKAAVAVRRWLLWPHTVRGWWATLDRELSPADLYHACGSLTVAAALAARRRDRRAGRRSVVVYDAIDDVMGSNNVLGMPRLVRWWLGRRERGWARSADARLTVNDELAARLADRWGIADRPVVIPNWPEPRPLPASPDRIREAIGLPPSTRVVVFQGRLGPNLGLDEAAEAILLIPDAVLVLIGFGRWFDRSRDRDSDPRFAGRHITLPAVHPDELVEWTASADVSVIPLPPVSANQRAATPNKLWESIAAGTPVVVGPGLPVMAGLVRRHELGTIAASLGPSDLAAAIRSLLDVTPEEADARRRRIASHAATEFSWPVAAERYAGVVRGLRDLPSDD